MKAAARSGVVGELLGRVLQSPLERERAFYRRYRELSSQIEETPNNISFYVLRGELNLERGEYERAKADFELAIELAGNMDDTKGWLVMEQVMRDRALYGLKLAEREL
jgi:tetratricopeptide (TPR) repeat protein